MKKLQFTALLFVLFGLGRLQAQMISSTYMLLNVQNCDVTVAYRVTDCVTGLCNNISQVLQPNIPFWVPCAGVGFDIYVLVTEMDYMPVGASGPCEVSAGGCYGVPPTSTVPLTAAYTAALIAAGCPPTPASCTAMASGVATVISY